MNVVTGPFARPVPDQATHSRRSAPDARVPATADMPFEDLLAQLSEQAASTQLQSFAGTGTLGHERNSDPAEASFQPAAAACAPDRSHLLGRTEAGPLEALDMLQDIGPRTLGGPEIAAEQHQDGALPARASPAGQAHLDAEASLVVRTEQELPAPEAEPFQYGRTRTVGGSREPTRAELTRMVGVALDTVDGELFARIWLPQCAPSERSRLRQAAHAMFAEHGVPDAELNVYEMGGPAVRQRRG